MAARADRSISHSVRGGPRERSIMWWVDGTDGSATEAVQRAQRGDSDAFRVLYRDIQPRLLRYLHALVGQDAEDVAAETWLHITRDLTGFTGDYDAFRGWTATIARHRALDHLRRASRRPPAVPVPAEDLATLPGTTDAALALINTLPPDQAEAVLLRAVLGLDAQTAGQVLGKRPGAIRTAAHRGLRTLAKQLERADPSAGVTRARDLALKEMR